MDQDLNTYCLDANALIQAWQKYYSRAICPDYWEVLNELGKEGKVTKASSPRIEIPNVRDNMEVRWINDFEFVRELNITFFVKK